MSYQALARKWRPRLFADLAGQEHVLRALVHALDNDRLHHAYLFTGTRGVGKTTIARIFAKALNCEAGVSSTPCGVCGACRDIDDGRFVDLIEVDAASRTKIEDTRDLLDNVQYSPARGRYKVYLIDEVHMLSRHSFNALLKTLEEPPPHVKFLLATTDPQNLPVTVLSRCLQFNLKRLPLALIRDRLRVVAKEESLEFEPPALDLLARAADGSMRDALSLLDQAASHGGGRLTEADVAAMLGTVDREHAVRLMDAVVSGDGPTLLAEMAALDERVPDYDDVLGTVAALVQRAAVLQAAPDVDDEEDGLTPRARPLANIAAPEDLQLWYQVAVAGRRDLPLAPSPRAGCEMVLLRMLAFRFSPPAVSGDPEGVGRPAPVPAAKPAAARAAASAPAASAAPSLPAAPPPSPASASGPLDDWEQMVDAMGLAGVTRQLARHCAYLGREGAVVHLVLDPAHEFLATSAQQESLRDALSAHFGTAVRLQLDFARPQEETPADRERRAAEQRQQAAEEAIQEDPLVREMQKVFDATVDRDSIRPAD
ncbi:DNA polymerase III subunit gamma/tau [Wenzhouxiangella sp. XN24]|uniref:DNA polymerase III subunit gamma/tau n=1 Tax=Wenzhouxiangella sp. XN24 TaxID=2713569 RepID=UPI0013EC74D2|nr:DNA polymerase III subunit gamma/tau [Wenzhouxiangella sp. XN24]NGX15424.1 DNA polymerase III subunit gamma/tau [Wenzhouxiangella sp. XN24]